MPEYPLVRVLHPEEHYRTDEVLWQGFAESACMAHKQVFLELAALIPGDDHRSKVSEARRDSVNHPSFVDPLLDRVGAFRYGFLRARIYLYLVTVPCHVDDIVDSKRFSIKNYRIQAHLKNPPFLVIMLLSEACSAIIMILG